MEESPDGPVEPSAWEIQRSRCLGHGDLVTVWAGRRVVRRSRAGVDLSLPGDVLAGVEVEVDLDWWKATLEQIRDEMAVLGG